jgi:RimJ/RimL family protein N-acetyltransferase
MKLEIFNLINDSKNNTEATFITNSTGTIHWDKSHCIFVEGNCSRGDLKDFVWENENAIKSRHIIKIYIDSDMTKRIVEKAFEDYSINLYKRVIYNNKDIKTYTCGPDNFEVSQALKNNSSLMNKEALLEEIVGTWGHFDNFARNGFGICNINDNFIRGWCLSEYNSNKKCGIGIETLEEYQRRGIALGMTECFLRICKTKGITPYWDSWEWNEGSIRTALGAGFKAIQKYEAYLIRF